MGCYVKNNGWELGNFCVKMIGLGFGLKLLVVSLLWPLWLCASRLDSFVAKCFIMMSECVMGMSGS